MADTTIKDMIFFEKL